nr:matrixin family metalloprotease [Arthrobacter ulcerisalmonis]
MDKPADAQVVATRAASAAIEGQDYSFMASINGQPIHWACDRAIDITLIGTTPAGSQEALQSIIEDLKSASGLPLRVGTPLGTRTTTQSTIAVYYAPNGTTIDNLSLNSDDELGVGGPTWNNEGVIISGEALVRNDTAAADPHTSEGQHVLMHEISHALGLGHSAERTPEVMAPQSASDDRPILGEGDLTALARVGCPH